MKIEYIITILSFGIIAICAGCTDRPPHCVIDNGNLLIYNAIPRSDMTGNKKWEYWVLDDSHHNWVYITDEEFKIGDMLEIKPAKQDL